jgi:hypothetical protein
MNNYIIIACAAFLMIMLCHHHAHAQTPAPEPSGEAQDQSTQDQDAKKMVLYKRLKISGIVLTGCGLGLFVPGIALTITGAIMVAVNFVTLQWYALSGWGAVYAAGVILASVGSAALLSGIPLWIVGAVREKRHRKMTALWPVLGLDPVTGTFTLGMGYAF